MGSIPYQWFLLTMFCFGANNHQEAAIVAPHPFYVSVTEVNQNISEKTLEVSCKFFADDFEKVLETVNKTKLDISSGKDKVSFDKFIPGYIAKHLKLSVESKAVILTYVGYEKEKESVYCYFEVANVTSAKSIDITNSLLYDLTHEQINIIHVTSNGKKKSSKLSYPEVKAGYRFK